MDGPVTVTVILPSMVPEEKVSGAGASVPAPLNATVPPLITSTPLVTRQLPLSVNVPPVKVLVP